MYMYIYIYLCVFICVCVYVCVYVCVRSRACGGSFDLTFCVYFRDTTFGSVFNTTPLDACNQTLSECPGEGLQKSHVRLHERAAFTST